MTKQLLIIALLFVQSCQSPQDCDMALYNCWIKSYNDFGFDLKNEMINLENELIEMKYLKNSSYESYIYFLCYYSDSNIYISNLKEFKSINNFQFNENHCDGLCKETSNEFSEFVNTYFKISVSGWDQNKLKNCLPKPKFDSNPIYKTWILLNIYLKLQAKSQFTKFLKEFAKPKDIQNVKDTLIFNDGTLFINGKKCSLKSLRVKTQGKKAIVFKTNGDITYGQLADLSDTLFKLGIELIVK